MMMWSCDSEWRTRRLPTSVPTVRRWQCCVCQSVTVLPTTLSLCWVMAAQCWRMLPFVLCFVSWVQLCSQESNLLKHEVVNVLLGPISWSLHDTNSDCKNTDIGSVSSLFTPRGVARLSWPVSLVFAYTFTNTSVNQFWQDIRPTHCH